VFIVRDINNATDETRGRNIMIFEAEIYACSIKG